MRRTQLAAIDIATGRPNSWNTLISNGAQTASVQALAIQGNTLYVGGRFNFIGGQPRQNIAALQLSNGSATSWNPGASSNVQTLAVNETTVYAGGQFTNIGGQARNRIAALDINTGNATFWNPNADSGVLKNCADG